MGSMLPYIAYMDPMGIGVPSFMIFMEPLRMGLKVHPRMRFLSEVYHSGFVTHLGMDILRYIFGLAYDPQTVILELLDTNVQVDRS